jgi:hypothetical protein
MCRRAVSVASAALDWLLDTARFWLRELTWTAVAWVASGPCRLLVRLFPAQAENRCFCFGGSSARRRAEQMLAALTAAWTSLWPTCRGVRAHGNGGRFQQFAAHHRAFLPDFS